MSELLSNTPADQEYQRARQELESGKVLAALARLEAALRQQDHPAWYSLLGFCIARERGYLKQGEELCRTCIAQQPHLPDHYYFLSRVMLLSGRTDEALQTLRQGLAQGDSSVIKALLQELGVRKPPPISRLHRDHPLNKYLGLLLTRLRLR